MPTITLKRDGVCADCGAELKAGEEARYYGPDKIYCLGEHKNYSGDKSQRQSAIRAKIAIAYCPECGAKLRIRLESGFEDS